LEKIIFITKKMMTPEEKEEVICFVDCETLGLPIKRFGKYPSPRHKGNYPDMISLSWQIRDSNGVLLVGPKYHIVRLSPTVSVPEFITNITGIDRKVMDEKGVQLNRILDSFEKDLYQNKVEKIVAHNVDFDKGFIQHSSLLRGWHDDPLLNYLDAIKTECTCEMSGYKKLTVAIKEYLQEEQENAHNAVDDMDYCMRVYFFLKKGLILPKTCE
jgi:DNA polymerase III alpha subunit (gram-positive type)